MIGQLPPSGCGISYPSQSISQYSLLQLSIAGIRELADTYQIELLEDQTTWRRELAKHTKRLHPLFSHPGILFMGLMSTDPDYYDCNPMGVFATHDGNVFWGFYMWMFEPYRDVDHS